MINTEQIKARQVPGAYFPLKREYFEQIKAGTKLEEYREPTPRRMKQLERLVPGDLIEFSLGYPKRDDKERRLRKIYAGHELKTITHDLFGPDPVEVVAIKFR